MRFVEKEPLSVRVCVILFRFKVIKLQNQIFSKCFIRLYSARGLNNGTNSRQ